MMETLFLLCLIDYRLLAPDYLLAHPFPAPVPPTARAVDVSAPHPPPLSSVSPAAGCPGGQCTVPVRRGLFFWRRR